MAKQIAYGEDARKALEDAQPEESTATEKI